MEESKNATGTPDNVLKKLQELNKSSDYVEAEDKKNKPRGSNLIPKKKKHKKR